MKKDQEEKNGKGNYNAVVYTFEARRNSIEKEDKKGIERRAIGISNSLENREIQKNKCVNNLSRKE